MTKMDLAMERKKQIIQATIECISRYGYNNFSMQDVARIADVSKGIIHYYFLNKEELMMAVLQKVSGDLEDLLSQVLHNEDEPTNKVRQLLTTVCQVVRHQREYYCISMDFWTQINQKEKVRELIAMHYAQFRQALEKIIQEGIERKVFKEGKASYLASLLIGMIDGVSLQWLFDADAFDHDEMVQTLVQASLAMLLP